MNEVGHVLLRNLYRALNMWLFVARVTRVDRLKGGKQRTT